MVLLKEIEEITTKKEKFPKISSMYSKIYFQIKGKGEERKLTFYTYNLLHRLIPSAIVWLVIILTNFLTVYYGMTYLGVIISIVLLLLILTPIRIWVLDFKNEKVLRIFKIFWIPIVRKEYTKKSFWNSKLEVTFNIFTYMTPEYGKDPEKLSQKKQCYTSLLQMENDVNEALKKADFGFIYFSFMLVQRAKEKEIEGSMPWGKISFSLSFPATNRILKNGENPFEVIMAKFFSKKNLQFMKLFTEFFPLSENFAKDDNGRKTYNKLLLTFTEKIRQYRED